jgi:carbamoyltransferase
MKILGISNDIIVSSACLLEDGKIIAASPEERLNRDKYSREFPVKAINFCLQQAKCRLSDIDYIAMAWNPGVHINRLNNRFSKIIRWRAEQLYAVPNYLLSIQNDARVDNIVQEITTTASRLKIMYLDHHKAHAATFFMSPFKEAAIMTCDGRGEEDTLTLSFGNENGITEISRQVFPQSIGLFYGAFTQFLGFRPDADEWKVMALYSYWVGKGKNPYTEKVRSTVKLLPEGKFELDLTYFSYYLHDVKSFYTEKFTEEFGPPRKKDEVLTERHYQIAHALQMVTEEIMTHILAWLAKKTKQANLVISGGTFMNSVYNGKITQQTPFKEVFISSCPDDSGTSIGAALHVYHQVLGNKKWEEMKHNYFGPEFSDEEMRVTLEKYKIPFKKVDKIESFAAKKISENKIIGWFQGKMEFGQRALGNRSILADARDPKMKDKINEAIKYREPFRPFAPSILIEDVSEYFELIGDKNVRFMEKVYPIKKSKQKLIPAVTHVDGSGRLQTVEKEINPKYHRLISEFKKITGIPIILNTSFNLNGEPIVCTPTDAIRTFYSCGMDILVLGDYVVEK